MLTPVDCVYIKLIMFSNCFMSQMKMEMKPFNEELCKGIVQQGSRKGLQFQREKGENGYCVYHQRNYEHDRLLADGKKVCSGFFRGCNNELTNDDLSKDRKFCSTCRVKKSGKEFNFREYF